MAKKPLEQMPDEPVTEAELDALGEPTFVRPGEKPAPSLATSGNDLAEILKLLGQQIIEIKQQGGGGLTAPDLQRILEGQRRAVNPSVETHPGISVFSSPRGDHADKAAGTYKKFHRQIYFNGHKEELEQCTVAEVDAYNRFSQSMPGPGSTRQARDGQWQAEVSRTNQDLHIKIPCKEIEALLNIPGSLHLVLMEFMDGPDAVDPFVLANNAHRVKDLEAQIAELRASVSLLSAR